MLGSVDFFQNHKILFFLYDLRAGSLDKTEGSTVLLLLELTGLRLPRSTMDVFQWRTVQPDRRLEHAQVDVRIGIRAGREDLCTLDHREPEHTFPRRPCRMRWCKSEGWTECFGWVLEAKTLLAYFQLRVVCQGDGRVGCGCRKYWTLVDKETVYPQNFYKCLNF